jgi:hypothetical protein
MKTRYAKPFEGVQIKIPYDRGMSPTSGLVDLFERKNILTKDGNSLKCTLFDGTVIKKFRKAWEKNEDQCLDQLMADMSNHPHRNKSTDESSTEEE